MNDSAFKRVMRKVNRIAALRASATMMTEIVYFNPACPSCGELQSIPLMRERVAESLRRQEAVILYTPCHDCEWEATPQERRELADLIFTPLPDGAPQYSSLPLMPSRAQAAWRTVSAR